MAQLGETGRLVIGTFADLADTLANDFHIGEFLQLLVERCTTVLMADIAGVLLEAPDGHLELSAATSDDMRTIEQIEIDAGRGPCIDAYRSGEAVIADDLAQVHDRWPEVVPKLLKMGMHAGYAFPLALRGDRIGALNLYRHRARTFSDDDQRIAQAFADVAAIGILQERAVASAERRSDQLQGALDSRIDIEQAKGMLAQRHGISPTAAFEVLRHYSRDNGRRVRDVSHQVIEGDVEIPMDR